MLVQIAPNLSLLLNKMVKKKINIILIIAVLALWGTVGYRTINRQFSSNEVSLENESQLKNITLNQINKDTFELEKINRDPFLNKQFQTTPTVVTRKVISNYIPVKKTTAAVVPKIDNSLKWPVLSYHGYIVSKERNEDLVLLKINSKLCRLRLNVPSNGVLVKKNYKDSIEVYFNSQSRIIKKQ
ncbi:hypothetical protein AB674_18330 [Flavobacterium sp. ABG]|nr:hypothetical protein AB674_18330 [Flavobacterium sp. ABG]